MNPTNKNAGKSPIFQGNDFIGEKGITHFYQAEYLKDDDLWKRQIKKPSQGKEIKQNYYFLNFFNKISLRNRNELDIHWNLLKIKIN